MTSSGRALLIVVVVAAGLAGFVASRFAAPTADAPAELPRTAATVTPAETRAPTPPVAATTATVPDLPAVAAAVAPPEPPRFDVVRVGARGVAVVAGRAAPGAEVVLLEEGGEIGRARADARGEWVILPAEPLRPGTRQLTLMARLGGTDTHGADVVVVVVPEPAPLVAEAPRQAAEPPRAHAGAAPAPAPMQAPAADAARTDQATAQPATAQPTTTQPTTAQQSTAAQPATTATATAQPTPAQPAPAQPLVVLLPGSQPVPRVLQGQTQQQGLALGQVDYDEAGAIRFAGTAAPGTTVRIYVNDQHAGDAQADPQGRWALSPGETIAVGRHRLRLDQLATAGAVAARIEVPFQRDRLPEEAVAGGRIIVQPGNNLWRLARAAYGRGVRFTVIYEANRDLIRNPNMIYPGQVFAVPGMADQAAITPTEASRSR